MIVFAQIAAKDFGDSMRDYQSGSPGNFLLIMIFILSTVALMILAWRLVLFRRARMEPLMLFHDLSEFHGIPRAIQGKMVHLARSHGIEDPARLFVCPELAEKIRLTEMARAGSDKEKRRLTEVFDGFFGVAFGRGNGANAEADGGAV
jgi:hypothetical protein